MNQFNTVLFSKITDSPKNGGAVQYTTDNKVLGVAPDQVVSFMYPEVSDEPGFILLVIRETGARLLMISGEHEYHDKAKTDVKAYNFVPSPIAKKAYPEHAHVSARISLID